MSRSPDELARVLAEFAEEYVPDGYRDDDGVWHDGPHLIEFRAALAELEAQAKAAHGYSVALREIAERGTTRNGNRVHRTPEAIIARASLAAAPSPADQKPCAACGYVGDHADTCPTHLFAEPSA